MLLWPVIKLVGVQQALHLYFFFYKVVYTRTPLVLFHVLNRPPRRNFLQLHKLGRFSTTTSIPYRDPLSSMFSAWIFIFRVTNPRYEKKRGRSRWKGTSKSFKIRPQSVLINLPSRPHLSRVVKETFFRRIRPVPVTGMGNDTPRNYPCFMGNQSQRKLIMTLYGLKLQR